MKKMVHIFSGVVVATIAIIAIFPAYSIAFDRKINFSKGWKFYLGDASGAEQSSFNDNSWERVALPHSVKVEAEAAPSNYYSGACWYRKAFTPDNTMAGKIIYLEFEGAMQKGSVWLNGEKLLDYKGGYTPFVIDISKKIKAAAPNTVSIKLDNRYDTQIPPGNSDPDFSYYGGLYRNVNLYVVNTLHISHPLVADIPGGGGVFASYSNVSSSSATITVKTHVVNESGSPRTCKVKRFLPYT